MDPLIVLSSYQLEWPLQYQKEKEILKRILRDHPISFHHIGSTSIPGCLSKPIIDILGVTSDLNQIDSYSTEFEESDYRVLGEYGMKRRLFFKKMPP